MQSCIKECCKGHMYDPNHKAQILATRTLHRTVQNLYHHSNVHQRTMMV
jgi:hypothetical protein